MLGRRPRHPLACLEPLLAVDGFRAWCEAYEPSTSHHRFMLAVLVAGSAPVSDAWRAVYAGWYDARQDPETGFPCHADSPHCLSPAFLLTTMRFALGGSVPRAERLVQTVLGFQTEAGGFTDSDLPGYLDMDASFLLHLLAPSAEQYGERIARALSRAGGFLEDVLADAPRRERLLSRPHQALAVCGNLSVLWRHFGTCGDRTVPFPWAELEHYHAPV